jgi:hypothetical protein
MLWVVLPVILKQNIVFKGIKITLAVAVLKQALSKIQTIFKDQPEEFLP